MKYLWIAFLIGLSAAAFALTSPPVTLPITITSANPTATLSANPTSVASGSSSTLTWGSTNATSCAGTGFSTGNATSGSVSTGALTATTSYSVNCGGATASATVTVTGGGGVPAPATAAGFTTATINDDFSQPSWANTANWLDCNDGVTSPPANPLYYRSWVGFASSARPSKAMSTRCRRCRASRSSPW